MWVDDEDRAFRAGRSSATVVTATYRAIVPLETDVTESDRVEKVEDRAASELYGEMYVDAVIRRKDHIELRLRGHA